MIFFPLFQDATHIPMPDVEVEKFTAIEYIVLTCVLAIFTILFFVVRSQMKSSSRYEKNLQSVINALKKMTTQNETILSYITEVKIGVSKEGTLEQVKEFVMLKLNELSTYLLKQASDIKTNNHIEGKEDIIKGRLIQLTTNAFNKLLASLNIFTYKQKVLSTYLDAECIQKYVKVLCDYIYSDETLESTKRQLHLIADETHNDFTTNLIIRLYNTNETEQGDNI